MPGNCALRAARTGSLAEQLARSRGGSGTKVVGDGGADRAQRARPCRRRRRMAGASSVPTGRATNGAQTPSISIARSQPLAVPAVDQVVARAAKQLERCGDVQRARQRDAKLGSQRSERNGPSDCQRNAGDAVSAWACPLRSGSSVEQVFPMVGCTRGHGADASTTPIRTINSPGLEWGGLSVQGREAIGEQRAAQLFEAQADAALDGAQGQARLGGDFVVRLAARRRRGG